MNKIKKINLLEIIKNSFSVVSNNFASFMGLICFQMMAIAVCAILIFLGFFASGLLYSCKYNICTYAVIGYFIGIFIAIVGFIHYVYLGITKMLLAGSEQKNTTLKVFFSVTWNEYVRTIIFTLVRIAPFFITFTLAYVAPFFGIFKQMDFIAPVWKWYQLFVHAFFVVRFSLAYCFVLETDCSVKDSLRKSMNIIKGTIAGFWLLFVAEAVFIMGINFFVIPFFFSPYRFLPFSNPVYGILLVIFQVFLITFFLTFYTAVVSGCGIYVYKKLTQ